MFSYHFVHREKPQSLASGGHFAAPRAGGFRDAPATELRSLVAAVEAGEPWRELVRVRYATTKPWLYHIIADPRRTAFFGPVLPAGSGPLLDIGAGWGQIARPLAATREVLALEPVAERIAFIRAAAQQDGVAARLTSLDADYLEVAFSTRFEAICAIGVLEWAGAFQSQADPQARQRAFLHKTRRELAPGGVLVLGIENRLGLKYLLGCPDDHLGAANIACLPAPLARQRCESVLGHPLHSFTYSLAELEALLRDAGYANIEFFAALPDYKLPSKIMSLADGGAAFNAWLATGSLPPEHNGYDGSPLAPDFAETLVAHYRSLAAEKIGHHFCPSFFVRAS